MRVISPYFEIITPVDREEVYRHIELCGRVCYKSEEKVGEGSAERLIRSMLARGHESPIEHYSISVRVICDRGVSHEWVRHRVASYSQESTRYCNYSKDKFGGEITFIKPAKLDEGTPEYEAWARAMENAERSYFELLQSLHDDLRLHFDIVRFSGIRAHRYGRRYCARRSLLLADRRQRRDHAG